MLRLISILFVEIYLNFVGLNREIHEAVEYNSLTEVMILYSSINMNTQQLFNVQCLLNKLIYNLAVKLFALLCSIKLFHFK